MCLLKCIAKKGGYTKLYTSKKECYKSGDEDEDEWYKRERVSQVCLVSTTAKKKMRKSCSRKKR